MIVHSLSVKWRRHTRVIPFMGLALFAACSGSASPTRASATGSWQGTAPGVGTLALNLTDAGGAVTGAGSLSGGTTSALTVTGSYQPPNLALTLASGVKQPVALTAWVNRDSMVAHLNGSGFVGEVITLKR